MTTAAPTASRPSRPHVRLEDEERPFFASQAGAAWAGNPEAARQAEAAKLTTGQAAAYLHFGVRRGSAVTYYRAAQERGVPKRIARAIAEEAGRRLQQAHCDTSRYDEQLRDLLHAFKNSKHSGGGHLLSGLANGVNPAEVSGRERQARTRDRRERKETRATDPHATEANPCDPRDYTTRGFRGALVTVADLRPKFEPVMLMQELAHAGA